MSLTSSPLFTQLSPSATSSAVGAFSLRAVNGVSVKAVQVQAHPVVQWPPTAMTSNTTVISGQLYGNGTYITTASVPNNTIWYIFDNNTTNYYEQATAIPYHMVTGTYIGSNATTISSVSVSGEWFQIQVPTAIILRSYTLVGRQDNFWWANRNPTTFWIAGSNDGSNWSNVNQQTNITPPQQGITMNIPTTSNSVPYTYYRLVVNVIGNSNIGVNQRNLVNLSSWNLYGDSPSYAPNVAQDFYADRLGNLLTVPVTGQTLANWLAGGTGYVATWYDQSGKGNHATQATAANQPVISLATTPASVVFTGNGTTSGQYLITGNIPFSIATTGKFGVQYIIANNVGGVLATIGPGNRKWWLGDGNATGAGEATQGNRPSLVGGGEAYAISGTAVTSAKTSVVYNSTASGSNFYYINGSSVSLSTNTKSWNSNQDGTYPLQIGWSSTFSYYSGNLFEFIMTNTSFTTNDIAVISAT